MSEVNNPLDPTLSSSSSEQLSEQVSNDQQTKISPELLKNVDWYAMAKKIRNSNRQLVKKIMELESLIQQKDEQLETQQRRCRSAETLIEQQTEELNQTQTELNNLYLDLESANQNIESQEKLIKSLTLELKTSQEQIANLERECSLLQDNFNQQKRQLLQAENQNKELQIRLQRQQRYTLQFKNALDHCLEHPTEKNKNQQDWEVSLTPKLSGIKPWSNTEHPQKDSTFNSSLHKKLLGTNFLDFQPIQDTNISINLELSPKELKDTEISQENLSSFPSEQVESNLNTEENIEQFDLPSSKINPDNSPENNPNEKSLFPVINSQDSKSKQTSKKPKPRKGFLQLPNLPKFIR
jgi:chromosome segregation ATPase